MASNLNSLITYIMGLSILVRDTREIVITVKIYVNTLELGIQMEIVGVFIIAVNLLPICWWQTLDNINGSKIIILSDTQGSLVFGLSNFCYSPIASKVVKSDSIILLHKTKYVTYFVSRYIKVKVEHYLLFMFSPQK